MRTTLTLDDDIYAAAKNLATLKSIALGEAISELARRGLERKANYAADAEFPSFSVSENSKVFGLAEVQAAENES